MKNKKTTVFLLLAVILLLLAILIILIVSLVSSLRAKTSGHENESENQADGTAGSVSQETGTESEPLPVTGEPDPVIDETPEFLSNLSEFEAYMNADDMRYLTLVNENHMLDESYKPDDLIDVVDTRNDGRQTQKMAEAAEKALQAMFTEARANGYTDLSVTSAYRSYSYQKQLFDQYTQNEMENHPGISREEAEKITSTYSARPGTSEHQTGLCCDMHNLPSADVAFAKTEAAKWLSENCWKFGYILRYPSNKTEITGIDFEPWHFRFVGRKHAKIIMSEGLCLEEYIQRIGG